MSHIINLCHGGYRTSSLLNAKMEKSQSGSCLACAGADCTESKIFQIKNILKDRNISFDILISENSKCAY